MSSAGQVAGYVVGGVVGSFFGNPIIGAQIGGMIGGYIDPPKGANTVGPRLEDLTVQTSTYGAVLPRIKGTVAVTGNVFWLEGDQIKEHAKTEKVGGKGGPTAKQTTFSYTATFAVGLSHQISAPIAGVRRLWLANTLVYDAGSGDINSIIASNQHAGVMFRFYDGRDDQKPDPRMQADKGAANVSGYPGRCYIVFYDLDLTEKYNNTLMATQVKVEMVCDGTPSPAHYTAFTTPYVGYLTNNGFTSNVISAHVSENKTTYAVSLLDASYNLYGFEFYEASYGEYIKKTGSIDLDVHFSYGHTSPGFLLIQDTRDGVVSIVVSQGLYISYETVFWFISNGAISQSRAYTDAEVDYGYYNIGACDSGYTFMADTGTAKPIIGFTGTTLYATSASSIKASAIALSESYVFVSNYAGWPGAVTVTVLNRLDLSLVANYTQAVNGNGRVAFHVISDAEFYLAAGQSLSHWVGGVATDLGGVLSAPAGSYPFRQIKVSSDPAFYIDFHGSSGNYELAGVLTNFTISAQSAKLRDIVTEECALAGIQASDLDLTELVNSDVRGYRVSQAGSVRAVLEQLQAAFPFDVIQSGYKLKFKSRGGASVLTVPESDLGAHTGNDTPSRFMLTTEMPSQVPAKVTFNFLNADREYDPDEQSAAFTAQDVKNSYTVSLPLVMTPTEALQAADVLLKKEQRERTSVGTFWLPPSDDYRKLEAADVIDVIAQGRTHTIRLTKVTQLPDGRVECDGKMTSSAAYASTAQAQNSLALGQTIVPLAGSTELMLLDIPMIDTAQDFPGLVAATYGYTSGWPGAAAFRSVDSGETYSALAGFDTKVEVFTATTALGVGRCDIVDVGSTLTVTPEWVGADLFSITEAQFNNLGNLAAFGADGRWEILCFKTAIDNTGSYTLRDFLRGRFGTEWAAGLHQIGDRLVMLDSNICQFIGLPLSAINLPALWRGVTSGASIDSAMDMAHTYSAVNLKPLAPCDLNGWLNPISNDWHVEVTPRSRHQVEPFSGLATPSGETISSFEFEVYSNDTYTTLKRTVASPTPYFDYTSAQQNSDMGGISTTLYLKVRQLSATVGRGYPLTAALSRALDDDPFSYLVTSLLHFDGANSSTTITDQIPANTWGVGGNAQLTTTSPLYGTSSLLTDGTGDYIYGPGGTNFTAALGDFTFEFSYTPASLAATTVLVDFRPAGTNGAYHYVDLSTGGILGYYVNSAYRITGTAVLVIGTRYRIAVSRVSGVTRMFVEGVQDGSSYTDGFNYTVGTNRPILGANGATLGANSANGKIDEWRYTKYGRYAANYTPRSTPFPNP